jgi:hypothetical protein
MELKKIIKYGIFIQIGCVLQTFLFYLRFNNLILRKELIAMMQKGNDYFLIFFYFDLIILLISIGLYTWVLGKNKKKKKSK